jgi:hypothetical protein
MDSSFLNKLHRLRVRNAAYRYFVPEKDLKTLIKESKEEVKGMVEHSGIPFYQQNEVLSTIFRDGYKTFGILAQMKRISLISKLMEFTHPQVEVSLDARLPMKLPELEKVIPEDATTFDEFQWEFIAPFFAENQSHRFLAPAVILPFTRDEHFTEGGFGKISQIDIHFDQQSFSNDAEYSSKVTSSYQYFRPSDDGVHYAQVGTDGFSGVYYMHPERAETLSN